MTSTSPYLFAACACLVAVLFLVVAWLVGAALNNAGTSLVLRPGQSTWIPSLDRRAS